MKSKATAAILTIAIGSGILVGALSLGSGTSASPKGSPGVGVIASGPADMDLFSVPVSPSPSRVFFESAGGEPIPARARREVAGMMTMMAALIDRMHEFDADGDGMLSDLEKMAMGYRLRKEMTSEHDLDGDGKMSGAEWRALQRRMFEQTPQGQALMKRFDLDGDGVLSEEEQASFDAHLEQQEREREDDDRARMDSDGDGEVSQDERRAARQQEQAFWQNQMRTAETSFDRDGDGELNIEESNNAWEAWVEYQTIDAFISEYDRDGDRSMGPADYNAFLSDYERRNPRADVNNDGEVDIKDITAFRDLVQRSRGV